MTHVAYLAAFSLRGFEIGAHIWALSSIHYYRLRPAIEQTFDSRGVAKNVWPRVLAQAFEESPRGACEPPNGGMRSGPTRRL